MPTPERLAVRVSFCPHCGNETPHRLLFSHEGRLLGYDEAGERSAEDVPVMYYVASCGTCSELLLYTAVFGDNISTFENGEETTLAYPLTTSLPEHVPIAVREAYEEAARIRSVAPNAYAVMIRRALEAVCDDRGVSQGHLQKRIAILAQRGELPPTLAEITSMLRVLGNAGAHSTGKKLTVPMTWGMAEFFEAIIEYIYIGPKKLNDFRKQLERQAEIAK